MRVAHNDVALKNAVTLCGHEAKSNFGDDGVYLEKFIENARHVEVQVLADDQGRVLTLGERECSIQRRHQKLIEETPCVALSTSLRSKMMKAATRAAKACGYTNAGTVEFLLSPDGQFYFIEFNARIQVEHPVTEEVTRMDLVAEQIKIAAGEPAPSSAPKPVGASIEARVYAEDPDHNFRPSPGKVENFHLPGGPGIRVDTHLFHGYVVPPYYDSLLAKVIAWGEDRDQAIDRLAGALDEFRIQGVMTTAAFCSKIVRSGRFRRGDLAMSMIDDFIPKSS